MAAVAALFLFLAAASESAIESAIKEVFSFKPADIIRQLDLLRPIYRRTTNYGHFGREDADLPWEETNKTADLKSDTISHDIVH